MFNIMKQALNYLQKHFANFKSFYLSTSSVHLFVIFIFKLF